MDILNPSFENWNFGTTFSNPPYTLQQVADDWYIYTAFLSDINRESVIVQSGTYSLKWQTGAADGGFLYQPNVDLSAFAGQTVTISAWVYTLQPWFVVYVNDGSYHTGTENTGTGTWEQISVTYNVPAIPTPVQIGIIDEVGVPPFLVYVDNFTINGSALTLSLSDSVSLADSLAPSFTISQNLSDSTVISDSAPQAFSVQSSYLAPVSVPVVETLVNQLVPANVKTYFEIEE